MLKNPKKLSIISVLILFGGMVLWLVFVEHRMRWCKREIGVIEQNLRKKGYVFSHGAIAYSGPFSFLAVHFRDVHLKTPDGLLEWSGEDVRFNMRPWSIRSINVVLAGKQTLILSEGNQKPPSVLTLEGAQGSVTLELPEKLESVALSLSRVLFSKGNELQPLALQDFSLQLTHLTQPLNADLSLRARLQGVENLLGKKEEAGSPLTFACEATLSGFQEQQTFPRSLAEWRDGGGIINIRQALVTWSPIVVEGDGTFTFDQDMYLLAAFSIQMTGSQHILDHMVRLGWLKKQNMPLVAFMVNMMGKPNEKGELSIRAPLTFQKRSVFLGGVPFPLYTFK